MFGQTGEVDANGQFNNLVYMKCPKENNFFPHLDEVPRADVYYFCSPNNPTGAGRHEGAARKNSSRALKDGSILVFDAAYAPFIKTPGVPTSIFEIPGAEKCAIEVNSFSKYAGFTGARLGWTVVPDALEYSDGSKGPRRLQPRDDDVLQRRVERHPERRHGLPVAGGQEGDRQSD